MIYLVGDTHGSNDCQKLLDIEAKEGDTVIVLGDFGFYWNNSEHEKLTRKLLSQKPYTLCFLDGNHENFDTLKEFCSVPMFDSFVGQHKEDNIFHLKRGEIYTIEDKTFFVMGGAYSVDKANRTIGQSWWPEEEPSYKEFKLAFENLDKVDNKVDYILSHNGPRSILDVYIKENAFRMYEKSDSVETFLDVISKETSFNNHYFGHWHDDWSFLKWTMVYDTVIRIED